MKFFCLFILLINIYQLKAELQIASRIANCFPEFTKFYVSVNSSNANQLHNASNLRVKLNGNSSSGNGKIRVTSKTNLTLVGTKTKGTFYFNHIALATNDFLRFFNLYWKDY